MLHPCTHITHKPITKFDSPPLQWTMPYIARRSTDQVCGSFTHKTAGQPIGHEKKKQNGVANRW